MGKWAKYEKKFKSEWLVAPEFNNWLAKVSGDEGKAYCKHCKAELRAQKNDLLRHGETRKHKLNVSRNTAKHHKNSLETSRENLCSKLEVNNEEIIDSPQESDESFSNIQIESLSQNCPSPPKKMKIKSSGIKRKSFDEAIGTFYKTLNSSFDDVETNLNDSDEAFGLYLAKELKNIKDISIKKKVKLKVMNIVLYADESTDENNSPRPFPIFVSTSGNISFSKANKIPYSKKES